MFSRIFFPLIITTSIFFTTEFRGHSKEIPYISQKFHWAVTKEKFELAMQRFRIKKTRYKTPVILCHGFFVNSRFLNLTMEHSLARYLAGEGFDIWNLSLRGNGRSLNPLSRGAKNWTMDDIIDRDLGAVVRYVKNESKRSSVSWVGFEMGGLLAYGYLQRMDPWGFSSVTTIGAPTTFDHPEQRPMKRLLKLEESPTLKKIFIYLNRPIVVRSLVPMMSSIEKLFYNPKNIERGVKKRLLETALTPVNPGLLDHILLMIRRGEFVSARDSFSYQKN